MAKPTLTVTTEFGTFKRQTARTYQFVVIGNGHTEAKIDQLIATDISLAKSGITYFADGGQAAVATNYDGTLTYTPQVIAAELDRFTAKLAALESGSVKAERMAQAAAEPFGAISWSGRLNLARNEAAKWIGIFRQVHIIDVATGQVVR